MTLDSFSTTRLVAERLAAAHLPQLRRMDQDEMFMARLGGVRDSRGTETYLAWNLEHWAEYGYGLWMLREAVTGAMVGRAVLRHVDVEGVDEVEVGYGFIPEAWGRGLATEVAVACVGIGRDRVGLESMVAITLPDHAASQRVMRKAGLSYERDFLHLGVPHVLFRTLGVKGPVRAV
ncbi:MAG: GNAT family N-acetyltransferase [Gemmatimonadales bacterium]